MNQIGVEEIEHLLPQNPYDRRAILADPTEIAKLKARKAREEQRQPTAQQQSPAARKAWDDDWARWGFEVCEKYLLAALAKNGWLCELFGEVIGKKTADVRKHMLDEVATLRRELAETTAKLQERLARLPSVKEWEPDTVHYTGDVVVRDGNVYQARRDTGTAPAADHPHWICIARAGHDGCDGLSPNVCGAFDPGKKYWRLDIVEFHGASWIARCDDPGACPGDDDTGWQLLSPGGPRGEPGVTGPRGRKGERGARGQDAPQIISWVLDYKRYTAIPTMSDGTAGAPLELRGLFEEFLMQTQGWARAE